MLIFSQYPLPEDCQRDDKFCLNCCPNRKKCREYEIAKIRKIDLSKIIENSIGSLQYESSLVSFATDDD